MTMQVNKDNIGKLTGGKLITALFHEHQADHVLNHALKMGYKAEEINILMSEETRNKFNAINNAIREKKNQGLVSGQTAESTTAQPDNIKGENGKSGTDSASLNQKPATDSVTNVPTDHVIKSTGIGGTLGVTTGIITGAVMAIGTAALISGLGLAIAGPIAVGLAGAGAGGIAGGVVGALINIGLDETKAKDFEDKIKNGSIMIALVPHSEEEREVIRRLWQQEGGIVLG